MMRRLLGATIAAGVMLLALAACGDGDERDSPVENVDALSSMTASGEMVCDFVSRERIVTAVGTEDFEVADEYVSHKPDDGLSGAGCSVHVDGDRVLTVLVDFMVSFDITEFKDGLSDDEYHQLPDDAGLGYSWTEESDGQRMGHARMSYGDFIIKTRVVGVADDSDPEVQAVATAQEAIHGLEIPDEWTLPETRPSR